MKLSASLKMLSALAAVGSVYAQSEETPIIGTKSTVIISLTLTEEIGGFLVKDTQIETDAAKFVTYEGVLNPRGFDAETAGKNYYEQKRTIKYRVPSEELDETENTIQESRKLLTTKYGNAQFLAELVEREIIPSHEEGVAKAIAGYSIVAVEFPSDDAPRFFVEKAGAAPIYIGSFAEGGDGYASDNPLVIGSYGGVEQITSAFSTKTKYRPVTEEGETHHEADEPTEAYSETFSGSEDAYFIINRADGSSVSTAGTLRFSGRYDAKNDLIVTGAVSATVAGSAGSESEGGEEESSSWSVYAVAGGTIKLTPFRVVADLSAYAAALD